MDNYKYLKPKLVDPIIGKKIIKTLTPPKKDYWEPTKNTCQSFYQNYIKPNIIIIIFIIFVLILLFYRYRVVKEERENKKLNIVITEQYVPVNNKSANTNNYQDEYAKLLVYLYNQQKEKLREPLISNNPKLAYPMYPYSKGSLVHSGSK